MTKKEIAILGARRRAAWAGMIGPPFFVAVFTIEGWFRPGYDPRRMFISELSLGPHGWVQIANFVVLGALLLVFARSVAAEFGEGKASRAGRILLSILGVALLASGPFVMDPASTPRDQWTWHGTVHQLMGALFFTLAPVTCFVFWGRFRSDPRWQRLQTWTLAAGMIILAAIVIQRVGPTQPPAPPNVFNAWVGAIQRAALVTFLSWIFTFAFAVFKRTSQDGLPITARQ